jgi:hypothetical protein
MLDMNNVCQTCTLTFYEIQQVGGEGNNDDVSDMLSIYLLKYVISIRV